MVSIYFLYNHYGINEVSETLAKAGQVEHSYGTLATIAILSALGFLPLIAIFFVYVYKMILPTML
jgi:hypothetical protein